MNRIKSLLFRRGQMNGIDVFFPATVRGIKGLLFQLVPTRYRAQKYNRQLRREIEEHPDRALTRRRVWRLARHRTEAILISTRLRERPAHSGS